MVKRSFYVCTILAVFTLLLQGGITSSGQAASPITLQGNFLIVWGDGGQNSNQTSVRYFLASQQYGTVELLVGNDLLTSVGGAVGLNQKVISVNGVWHETGKSLIVQSILPASGQLLKPQGVYGPQPWVSILCKFADVPGEPNDLNFFKQMYSSEYPGLDHFWRQNSYDLANLEGSGAYGWFMLPHERAYYFDGSGNLIHQRAAEDCTSVAEPYVDFRPFVGINLMFNDNLDCCAWGGAWYLCLDGLCQVWRMTWEPPWGYQNIGVIAHETGHGFGLPHSLGNCQGGYDNRWDVLSDVWSNGTDPNFPQYGTMGQHTISYHKEMLEWITADQQYTAGTGTMKTITLERLALPQTGNYLEARILINNTTEHFYTLEVRQPTGSPINYDKWLPGFAVIIHDIVPGRGDPAVVIDQDANCDTSDEGAMYKPGEVFIDDTNGIRVSIDEATQSGYVVTISNQFTAMQSVGLAGAEMGNVYESIPFTATVSPADATIPITYTWEATGLSPIIHTGGTTDSVEFNWDEPGSKGITVTASNAGGRVIDTHNLSIGSLFPVVSIDGPTESAVGEVNTFIATSVPTDVVLPITYTWMAEGQLPITHTGGLTDSVNFVWDEPGEKIVEVTARNINGSTSDTFPIRVGKAPDSIKVTGIETGLSRDSYEFVATVLPITTTVPLTYVWTVDGEETITHTNGISDTLFFSWDLPGVHQIEVRASNLTGEVNGSWSITIYIAIYLPMSLKD
jgi:hypothetical protein